MPRLKSLLVITLLVAPHLRADALSDLKTTLGRLRGSGPIIATLQLETSRQTREDGADESEQGRVAVEVEDRADGLKISYPRSLLTQADQEMVANRIDPEKNTPIRTTMQSIGALDASDALNFAPFLLGLLERANLTASRPASLHGRKATLLSLTLSPSMPKSAKKRVKKFDSSMSIWIGEDGIPFAAEREDRVKASFLLLSFENLHKASLTFETHGDRLVATRHETENSGSGLGQNYRQKEITTIVVSR